MLFIPTWALETPELIAVRARIVAQQIDDESWPLPVDVITGLDNELIRRGVTPE